MQDQRIIIVGAGVFGLSTALHLTDRDVTIFDHQPYHENAYDPAKGCDGASADVNKIFRCKYQDLAFSGRDIWQRWNREIASSAAENLPQGLSPSTELFVNNGFLRVSAGSSLSAYDQECLEQLDKAGLRDYQHVVLDVDQPGQNWIHKLDLYSEKTSPEDGKPLEAFLDTSAGFTRADKAGVKFILGKEGRLAKLIQEERNGERVVSGIATTDGKTHSADLVVVAAGSWTPSIVPGLSHVLEATAGSVITIKLPEDRKDLWDKVSLWQELADAQYSPDKFPVIAYGLTGHNSPVYGGLYGFPRTEHGLIKIGYRGRKWTNFEESKFTGEMCWYTDSNDNNTLFVCSGGSGHGFKFLPVLGKVSACVERADLQHVVNQIEGVQDQFTPLWRFRKPEGGQTNLNGLEEGEDGERLLRKLKLADQSYWTWAVDKAQEVMTDLTNGMNRVL
ncbi:hypothetical protein IAU60_005424 [Kwoniella sp. DSM 27419]